MNANTVFRFEFVSSSDQENDESTDKKEDESDKIDSDQRNYLNTRLSVPPSAHLHCQRSSQRANCPNGYLNSAETQCQKLNHQIKTNFDYRLQQQHSQRSFNRQLSQRLTQHLNSLQPDQTFIHRLKGVHRTKLRQSRLFGLSIAVFNYHRASLTKLKLKLIYLIHLVVYYLQFLVTDVFHYFIFKYLLPNRYQRRVLLKWLNRATNHDLIKSGPNCSGQWETAHSSHKRSAANSSTANSIDAAEPNKELSLTNLFGDGRLLCGLVEHLNAGACPRYDLLDSNDMHINLDLAYRLILTHFGLDEKLNLVNLNADEAEQKLISLISKIRYIEVKRHLCARYEIDDDQRSHNAGKSSMQENYLIKGMGLFAGIKNKISFFNIFYFKFIDIVVEIVGPSSYACKRIKVDNFKLVEKNKKQCHSRSGEKSTSDGQCLTARTSVTNQNDAKQLDQQQNHGQQLAAQEIPLKFVVKKQLIEISYIALRAGSHRISIVHQGNLILNSPYSVKIDDCD